MIKKLLDIICDVTVCIKYFGLTAFLLVMVYSVTAHTLIIH